MPADNDRVIAGRYRLESQLGRGGSGVVWRAHDLRLGRRVAVKEVLSALAVADGDDDAVRRRVLREARAAARINLSSVTQVYDVLVEGPTLYLVMEYVEAPSLRDVVRDRGPQPPEAVAELGLALLDALDAAHAAGVVHRDVKPANVLVPATGPPKLTDFGIASLTGDATVTATGLIFGSPSYMAPEQAAGHAVGPAADLWGLGATLWYAVEAAAPFERDEPLATIAAVLHAPLPEPQRAGPLAPALRMALHKDPDQRADTDTLRGALEAVADGRAAPAPSTPYEREPAARAPAAPLAAGPPRARRGPLALSAAVLVAAGVVVVALVLALRPAPEVDPSPEPDPPVETEGSPEPAAPDFEAEEVEIGATGATVAVPAGWEPRARSDTITDYVDPGGGRFLRLDWTDAPRSDPVAAWQELSATLAGSREGYEELRIEPTEVAGLPAALWEYRLVVEGQPRRAYNLGIAGEDFGWALNLHVDAEGWEDAQDLWRAVVDSFQPAQPAQGG